MLYRYAPSSPYYTIRIDTCPHSKYSLLMAYVAFFYETKAENIKEKIYKCILYNNICFKNVSL